MALLDKVSIYTCDQGANVFNSILQGALCRPNSNLPCSPHPKVAQAFIDLVSSCKNLSDVTSALDAPTMTWSSVDSLPSHLNQSYILSQRLLPNTSHLESLAVYPSGSEATEVFKKAVVALNVYAVPLVCILGMFGDMASFFIFVFTSFRYQPCSQYLAALTFVDTLFLWSLLMGSSVTFYPRLAFAPGYCSVMVYLSYVCSFLSSWFVVLMIMERYIVVCHPFRASLICNKRKALTVICSMTTLALVLFSHSFFTTTNKHAGNGCAVDEQFYEFLIIFTYVDSIMTFVVPFLLIVFLNLRIIFTVRKFRLRQNRMHRSIYRTQRYQNNENTLSLAQVRTTKMLVWVSSVFVILYLPSYGARLYGMIWEKALGQRTTQEVQIAQQMCQFLYVLNFAVDFIVYVVTSSNFRRNLTRCVRKLIRTGYRYYLPN